jgi:hypothetical protein
MNPWEGFFLFAGLSALIFAALSLGDKINKTNEMLGEILTELRTTNSTLDEHWSEDHRE